MKTAVSSQSSACTLAAELSSLLPFLGAIVSDIPFPSIQSPPRSVESTATHAAICSVYSLVRLSLSSGCMHCNARCYRNAELYHNSTMHCLELQRMTQGVNEREHKGQHVPGPTVQSSLQKSCNRHVKINKLS